MAPPRKKRYKTYLCNPKLMIPKRTVRRHNETNAADSSILIVNNDTPSSSEQHNQSEDIIGCEDSDSDLSSINMSLDDISSDDNEISDPVEDSRGKEIFDEMALNDSLNSETTRFEALLMILHYSFRHGLSNSAIIDLISLINKIAGTEVLPPSMYLLRKIFSSDFRYDIHFYCKVCMTYLGKMPESEALTSTVCDVCSTKMNSKLLNDGHFFITMPISPQIKQILEEPGMEQKIFSVPSAPNTCDTLSDLKNGSAFSRLIKKGLFNINIDLSVTFNTDGSPIFKSVKNSLWPIQFRLNELPLEERFESHRNLVAGLWFGSKEPAMPTFFTPFLKEAKVLSKEGLVWGYGKASKVFFLLCVADSVAKPQLQNVKQFNGKYGCPYCYHPGEIVEGNQIRYPVHTMYPNRKNKEMRDDMVEAEETGNVVRGIKGLSPFCLLPYFDIVYGFPIDYMHCCLLGVVRLSANLWTSSANHSEEYYLSELKRKKVDERLQSISPPQCISRRPRPLSDMVHWKANEWRSWLLFYAIPCLDNILPSKYVKHMALLSSAIYNLLQNYISKCDVDTSNLFLHQFVIKFEELYGKKHMNFNVHLLLHLSKCVSVWGPLWLFSAFTFESGNGYLVKLVKGTKGASQQIASKYCIFASIPKCIQIYTVGNDVLEFCDKLMTYRRVKRAMKISKVTVISGFKFFNPDPEEMQALAEINVQDKNILFTKKIILNSVMFMIKSKKSKKCNDSIVKLADNTYCEAQKFIKLNNAYSEQQHLFGKIIRIFLSTSVAGTSTGSKWRSRRKLLTPSFHFRILDDFLPTFNEQSLVLVKKLRELKDADHVDIMPLVVLCTLDMVCETVMGVSIGAQTGENPKYVQAVHK
ncbi:unnamed protein product [Larinioides sclopetarius]|uniref:Transposase domain-containing protein n=1 Tax=Larinioides sclopetarius TaxID=280406 RepID=A0AAV2BHS4_9ARAC